MFRIVSCVMAVLLFVEVSSAAAPPLSSSRDRDGDPLPHGVVLRLGTLRFQHFLSDCGRLRFSPDGKTLISSTRHHVKVWRTATGEQVGFPLSGKVEAAALTADGKTLVLVVFVEPDGDKIRERKSSRSLQRWDLHQRKLLRQVELPGDGDPYFALSDDGRAVAAYLFNKGSAVWDDAGRKLADFAADSYDPPAIGFGFSRPPIALSHDRRLLAVSGHNLALAVYDVRGKEKLHSLRSDDAPDGFYGPCFSPDGSRLAARGETSLHLWDVKTGKLLHRRETSSGPILTRHVGNDARPFLVEQRAPFAFSPDGKCIASADHLVIRLLDARNLKTLRTFAPHHQGHVSALAFSPDGKQLALGGDCITLWDVASGKKLTDPDGHQAEVKSLAFSADSSRLASGGSDGAACVWHLPTGRMLHRFRDHQNRVPGLAFSPDGKTLATGDGDHYAKDGCEAQVRLFDLTSGRRTLQFPAHLHSAHTLRFSPDGKSLASGGNDLRVRLWDVANGRRLWQARSFHTPVVFLDRGKSLLLRSLDHKYATFDVATGDQRGRAHYDRRHPISGVVLDWEGGHQGRTYSFDGQTRTEDGAWGGSYRRKMALRDHGTDRPFAHVEPASVAAFSPDGRWLAVGHNTTILIYDVEQLRIEHLCDELLAGRDDARLKRNVAGVGREMRRRMRLLTQAEPHVRDLDAEELEVREKATAELQKLGEAARLPLEEARHSKSPEVRRRAAKLLSRLDSNRADLTPARLAQSLKDLATLGEPARQLVEELSRGSTESVVAQAARKALGKK